MKCAGLGQSWLVSAGLRCETPNLHACHAPLRAQGVIRDLGKMVPLR